MSSIPIMKCDKCGVEGEVQNVVNQCEVCNGIKCNECDTVEVYNGDFDIAFCSKCYKSEDYEICINYYLVQN